jgi:hypothetical protein
MLRCDRPKTGTAPIFEKRLTRHRDYKAAKNEVAVAKRLAAQLCGPSVTDPVRGLICREGRVSSPAVAVRRARA